ncbi:hypothetical protein [Halorussus lipolyticus]|nr:hypothetical protein [Halorussus sp. DT80]
MKDKSPGVLLADVNMDYTDPEGLFDIILWGIVLMAAIVLAYLLLFGSF